MGLDAYLYYSSEKSDSDTEHEYNHDALTEAAYWRKNYPLQNWMHELFTKKGGKGPFNCTSLRLRVEDLQQLMEDVHDFNIEVGQMSMIIGVVEDAISHAILTEDEIIYWSWW